MAGSVTFLKPHLSPMEYWIPLNHEPEQPLLFLPKLLCITDTPKKETCNETPLHLLIVGGCGFTYDSPSNAINLLIEALLYNKTAKVFLSFSVYFHVQHCKLRTQDKLPPPQTHTTPTSCTLRVGFPCRDSRKKGDNHPPVLSP